MCIKHNWLVYDIVWYYPLLIINQSVVHDLPENSPWISHQEVWVAWDTLQDCSGNHFCHWKTQLVPQMVENFRLFIFFLWLSLRFSTWTILKNVNMTYLSSSIRKHQISHENTTNRHQRQARQARGMPQDRNVSGAPWRGCWTTAGLAHDAHDPMFHRSFGHGFGHERDQKNETDLRLQNGRWKMFGSLWVFFFLFWTWSLDTKWYRWYFGMVSLDCAVVGDQWILFILGWWCWRGFPWQQVSSSWQYKKRHRGWNSVASSPWFTAWCVKFSIWNLWKVGECRRMLDRSSSWRSVIWWSPRVWRKWPPSSWRTSRASPNPVTWTIWIGIVAIKGCLKL